MNLNYRILTGLVAATTSLALAGCGPTASSAHAQLAQTWVEHLCNAEYTAANDLTRPGSIHRVSGNDYPESTTALAGAEDLGKAQLERQQEADLDIAPDISVSEVSARDTLTFVEVTGTCFGIPFDGRVSIEEYAGEPYVFQSLPLNGAHVASGDLGLASPEMTVDTGQFFEVYGDEENAWFVPPGEHEVTLEPHFLVPDPPTITWSATIFGVVDEQNDLSTADIDVSAIDDSYADFVSRCGEECQVPNSAVISPGSYAEGAVEMRPSDADNSAGWTTVRPAPSPDWTNVRLSTWQAGMLDRGYAEPGAGEISGQAIAYVHFIEIDDEVHVAGFEID
ncbi:MAG: hypothetical protein ACTHXA_10295 [Gulosibacter sp.]|uniref:hypothetical protein n=1 Tax=Gulosibacter sp. TaxID=2817531 RepID=UPI003F8F2DDC